MFKGNKGITLIALVITIIVLLILAGISIAMLTGSSGVLTKANQADIQNARGEAADRINTALNGVFAELIAESQGVGGIDMTAADIEGVNGLDTDAAQKIGDYEVSEPNFKLTENGDAVVISWTPHDQTKFGGKIEGKITYHKDGVFDSQTNYGKANNKIKYKVEPAVSDYTDGAVASPGAGA